MVTWWFVLDPHATGLADNFSAGLIQIAALCWLSLNFYGGGRLNGFPA